MKMQPNSSHTVKGRGAKRRPASAGQVTFSGSQLLLSVGFFLALSSLSIWLLVQSIFAK